MDEQINPDVSVSVVMPVYNEEKYIENCIDSLLRQDYPRDGMEWILVDGRSTDHTKNILCAYMLLYPKLIKIYDNPGRAVSLAMNIGINASVGRYVIRLDAHAEYAPDYISKCVKYLETMDVDNVGGVLETKSNGLIGNAIALMLSSRFGVGNSRFRTHGESGLVDTVPFGAFRREVFDKYGLFDERLVRNEDNEMNHRIRKNGGKVYLTQDIKLSYYCRENFREIVSMAVKNGQWNSITARLCPGAMRARHFIPSAAVLLLISMPMIGFIFPPSALLLLLLIGIYIILDVVFSLKAAIRIIFLPLLLVLFPVFHISYGFGTLMGFAYRVH